MHTGSTGNPALCLYSLANSARLHGLRKCGRLHDALGPMMAPIMFAPVQPRNADITGYPQMVKCNNIRPTSTHARLTGAHPYDLHPGQTPPATLSSSLMPLPRPPAATSCRRPQRKYVATQTWPQRIPPAQRAWCKLPAECSAGRPCTKVFTRPQSSPRRPRPAR